MGVLESNDFFPQIGVQSQKFLQKMRWYEFLVENVNFTISNENE